MADDDPVAMVTPEGAEFLKAAIDDQLERLGVERLEHQMVGPSAATAYCKVCNLSTRRLGRWCSGKDERK